MRKWQGTPTLKDAPESGVHIALFVIMGVLFAAFIVGMATSGCEAGARFVTNKIVEEVTETDTLLVLPEGRPWQIVDSLHNELAGLRLQLAECEG